MGAMATSTKTKRDEDQLFKDSYFQYYKGSLTGEKTIHLTELNGESCDKRLPVNIFMGIDPASSTRQTADFSTIVSVAIDKDNNRYLLPYYRKRVSPMALADAIIDQFKLYKPDKCRIESVGYQEMLREYIRQRCEEEQIFISGLEIKENPRNSKSSRLETLEPYFAQKKVYMQDDMQDFKNELLLYPRSKHDDLLDGFYYANKKSYTPAHEADQGDDVKAKIVDKQDYSWLVA